MNKKKVSALRIVFEVVLQVIFFTSIGFALYFGILNLPLSNWYKMLYVVAATVIAYVARRVIKSASVFLMLHIALVVGAFMTGIYASDEEAFVMVLIVAVVSAGSFIFRRMVIDNNHEIIHIAGAFVFLAEYFSGYGSDNEIVMEASIWCAVVYVVVYIFYTACIRLDDLFFINSGTSNFPGKRIVTTNVTIISIVSFMTLVGMLLFYNGPLGNIFVILKNVFLKILGWLLSLFLKPEENQDILETVATLEVESESDTEGYYDRLPLNPMRDFWNALVIIIGIIASIVAIYFLIRAFRKRFYYVRRVAGSEADVIEDIDDDISAVETVSHNKEAEINDKDLNLRARKIYKKQVRSVKKEKGTPSDSALARDITKMFEEGDRADEVTRIYEKARYSDEKVTKEEVDILKKNT
ncbi:MAG: hypothetical protein ACI4EV_02320 [Lachnospiraceae bacterium]